MKNSKLHRSGQGGNISPLPTTTDLTAEGRNFVVTTWDANPLEFTTHMRFLAYAQETCPTTQRLHWQTYLSFKDVKTLSAAIKYISKLCITHPSVDIMRGTFQDNEKYCSKQGTLIKHGKEPHQGQRNDLVDLVGQIREGRRVDDIALENPQMFHQYGRTFSVVEDITMRQLFRTEMTLCDWLVGPTGSGKSHTALSTYNPSTHYILPDDNGWWDGYRQQETVVIQEFRGDTMKYSQLLELIDKWPYFVRRRNREPMPFTSKKVIITSPLTPEECYRGVLARNDNIDQLLRRVNVIHMENRN